jgi:hypothetical protein
MQTSRNIVWIASYPKSGNTWVRFLLCNLLFGRQESAATVSALVPDIHELGASVIEGPPPAQILKTHFRYSAALPWVNGTAAAIYVVRQPDDVLLSNFHYAQRSAAEGVGSAHAFDRYVEDFIAHRGDPRWTRLGMGSWDENVVSWLEAPKPFPVLAIRYEDLSANPERVCQHLVRALRLSCTTDDIRRAIENSSFHRMREIELADIRDKRIGIFYKPYLEQPIEAGRRFMRRGDVGEARTGLAQAQRQRLYAAFAPLMARLQYAA